MSTSKYINRICAVAVIVALLLTTVMINGKALGLQEKESFMGYENRLFDTSKVHTIDIEIDDWDSFIDSCQSEEYSLCSVIIDNEAIRNVGIRGKGNTSLSTVSSMDSDRYSFKIEFDQYDNTKSYHGLDKLSLNNLIQDNTYMKDYLAYRMMGAFGVDAPLCSFVWITVNGEDWGLYLAVEGVEDSFLERNYGTEKGDLYKPDSMSFGGGGPGNGRDFDMKDFMKQFESDSEDEGEAEDETGDATDDAGDDAGQQPDMSNMPSGDFPDMDSMPSGDFPDMGNMPSGDFPDMGNMPSGDMPDMSSMPSGDFPDMDASASDESTSDDSSDKDDSSSTESRRSPGGGFGGGPGGGFGGGFGGMGSDDVKLKYIDDDPDSYSNIFNNAKTDLTVSDKARLIESLKKLSEGEDLEEVLDVEEVLRYFVVHNFVRNGDSYTGSMIHNYYLYEYDGQLSMIPWDYNLAYGTFSASNASSDVNAPIDTPVSGLSEGDRPMVEWIFNDETYLEQYHALFAEFLETVDIQGMIDEAYNLIQSYVEKDPTAFCTYEEFEEGVSTMKTFCSLRSESVKGQLDGTIPSTQEGQQEDSSALIDTTGLNLSDMGTMNSGNKGGGSASGMGFPGQGGEGSAGMSFPGMPGEIGAPEEAETPEETETTEETETSEETESSENAEQPEEMKEPETTAESEKTGSRQEMSSRPDMSGMSGFPGNMAGMGQGSATDKNTMILLGVSVLVLAAGILIAALFKH